jgi:hypothetical protein
MINVLIVPSTDGINSVGVVLGPEDIFLSVEGTPQSGVALSPKSARLLAQKLLDAAEQVERSGNFLHDE